MNRRDLEEELADLRNDRAAVLFNARKAVCGARRLSKDAKRLACEVVDQMVDDMFFEPIDDIEEQIRDLDAAAEVRWQREMRSE